MNVIEQALSIAKATRSNLLNALEGIDENILNRIPEGFNNNLIWNAGHIVVTQQLLCYGLSGLPLRIPAEVVERYRKGSRPTQPVSVAEISQIRTWLAESLDWIREDVAANRFQQFKTYPTSYGYTLTSFVDAVVFNNVHEGMHYGYIIALKKHLGV